MEREPYPINEGVSGYWDHLDAEELERFDYAMDMAVAYVEAIREIKQLTNEDHKVAFQLFADGFLKTLEDKMPSPGAFYQGPGIPPEEE